MKNQRHTVAGRNLLESPGGGGAIELVRAADDFVEPVDKGLLFIRWADGITHDVDEENVRNLEADIGFRCFRHGVSILPSIPSLSTRSSRGQRSERKKTPNAHVQVRQRV